MARRRAISTGIFPRRAFGSNSSKFAPSGTYRGLATAPMWDRRRKATVIRCCVAGLAAGDASTFVLRASSMPAVSTPRLGKDQIGAYARASSNRPMRRCWPCMPRMGEGERHRLESRRPVRGELAKQRPRRCAASSHRSPSTRHPRDQRLAHLRIRQRPQARRPRSARTLRVPPPCRRHPSSAAPTESSPGTAATNRARISPRTSWSTPAISASAPIRRRCTRSPTGSPSRGEWAPFHRDGWRAFVYSDPEKTRCAMPPSMSRVQRPFASRIGEGGE